MSETLDRCMGLCRYIGGESTPRGIESRWHHIFNLVLRDFGVPGRVRTWMWCDLANGNWEHMHLTNEEQLKTADEWLDDFEGDVFYCSDRWSLDRLTRCHWQFRQYWRAATGEFWHCDDLIDRDVRRIRNEWRRGK